MPRPADDHRHARAAFIDAVFAAAIRSRRPMLPRKLDRLILITVEQDRAIVAAEDHQRIVRDAERAELVHQRAEGPVELDDRVAARPHGRSSEERRGGKVGVETWRSWW